MKRKYYEKYMHDELKKKEWIKLQEKKMVKNAQAWLDEKLKDGTIDRDLAECTACEG